jgi:hypothetical protein
VPQSPRAGAVKIVARLLPRHRLLFSHHGQHGEAAEEAEARKREIPLRG